MKQLNKKNVGIDNIGTFPGYQHEDGLHNHNINVHNSLLEMFDNLSKDILGAFPNIESVLDVGSGAGYLGVGLKKRNPNINVVTLDGNYESINSPYIDNEKHFTLRTDVDYTLVDDNNEIILFNMICSFEHFEHIPKDTFAVFMKNMLKHSKKGTILFASAANWGYPSEKSHVHCNVKNKKDWHKYLTENFPLEKNKLSILTKTNFGGRATSSSELIYNVIENG